MNFIFKHEDAPTFERLWNEYLSTHRSDFHYALALIEYALSYSSRLHMDQSFVVEENNRCVGLCFLPIETSTHDGLSISIAEGYVIAPLACSHKYEEAIFEKIDAICALFNISLVKFKLSAFEDSRFNRLRLYGFIDTTSTTGTLDLQTSKEELWTNLRKRYKSFINSVIKNDAFSILYSDHSNAQTLHQTYVAFHKIHMQNAGKIPKSDEIYRKQFTLIENRLATLLAVCYQDSIVMANYFFHDTRNVIYASSAYDTRELFHHLPLNHYLLWHAIVYFKEQNFTTFGFGEPCILNAINGFTDYADEKELNISHFKRGMGAQTISHMQAIKFYHYEPLIRLIDQFKLEVTNAFCKH